jgi:hypothetical protein
MVDYRTYLTAFVAMFLALALGMLIGSALVGSPSTDRQQKELRALQQSFTQFNKQFGELREQSDNLKERLGRSDSAIRDLMRPHVANRLPGMRIAVILCGEQADTNFLRELEETVQDAGGTVVSVTRVSDDWLPVHPEARARVADAFGLRPYASDEQLARVLAGAVARGNGKALKAAAESAAGLRLDGVYERPADAVLVITGSNTPDRLVRAEAGQTPERGILTALGTAGIRTVLAEPDGDESISTIPAFSRLVTASVDNIDMAAGRFSAVYALDGVDGRFGIKRAAERPIPDLTQTQ